MSAKTQDNQQQQADGEAEPPTTPPAAGEAAVAAYNGSTPAFCELPLPEGGLGGLLNPTLLLLAQDNFPDLTLIAKRGKQQSAAAPTSSSISGNGAKAASEEGDGNASSNSSKRCADWDKNRWKQLYPWKPLQPTANEHRFVGCIPSFDAVWWGAVPLAAAAGLHGAAAAEETAETGAAVERGSSTSSTSGAEAAGAATAAGFAEQAAAGSGADGDRSVAVVRAGSEESHVPDDLLVPSLELPLHLGFGEHRCISLPDSADSTKREEGHSREGPTNTEQQQQQQGKEEKQGVLGASEDWWFIQPVDPVRDEVVPLLQSCKVQLCVQLQRQRQQAGRMEVGQSRLPSASPPPDQRQKQQEEEQQVVPGTPELVLPPGGGGGDGGCTANTPGGDGSSGGTARATCRTAGGAGLAAAVAVAARGGGGGDKAVAGNAQPPVILLQLLIGTQGYGVDHPVPGASGLKSGHRVGQHTHHHQQQQQLLQRVTDDITQVAEGQRRHQQQREGKADAAAAGGGGDISRDAATGGVQELAAAGGAGGGGEAAEVAAGGGGGGLGAMRSSSRQQQQQQGLATEPRIGLEVRLSNARCLLCDLQVTSAQAMAAHFQLSHDLFGCSAHPGGVVRVWVKEGVVEDRTGEVISEEAERLAQGQHAKVGQRGGVEGEGVDRGWVCERSGVGWGGWTWVEKGPCEYKAGYVRGTPVDDLMLVRGGGGGGQDWGGYQ